MDKYKDLTLPQIEALFNEKKAALLALRAATASNPALATVEKADEAQQLSQDLADLKAAGEKLTAAFAPAEDIEFAPKAKEPEPEPAAAPAPAPAGDEQTQQVSVGDQAAAGETGDEDAEKARVTHTEHVQDPVDPAQVDRGQIAGPDGDGVDLPTRSEAAGGVATLAARGTTPDVPAHRRGGGRVSLVASAGLDTVAAGTTLDSYLDVAAASIEQAKSFPEWQQPKGQLRTIGEAGGHRIQKSGTAMVEVEFPGELLVDDRTMTPFQMEDVMNRAADETSLPGGSLLAAGGWCAPSETDYALQVDATRDGMLSHPEVGIRRGGLKWPIAPDFSDFYANPGFKYTEAEVIGGVTKPCVTVPCPDFDEARLSVEGLCVKVDILTNVGYPEVVRNFIEGTMIAHDHWMNATKIAAMATIAGAAKVLDGLGATTTDTLNGLEIMAERTRQTYKLGLNTTLEVVVPFWVRSAVRADLSNRTGVPLESITDEQIRALFRARRLNVQFVYDWQELPLTDDGGTAGVNEAVDYPATYNALMYPAGTFVFGTAPVINLSTVYDAASLAANQYTGLFTEQGWLVAKRKFHADLLTLPVCNAGRTGAANLTCA